jgi:hypothetical protein
MGEPSLHWTVVSQRELDEEEEDFVINIYLKIDFTLHV